MDLSASTISILGLGAALAALAFRTRDTRKLPPGPPRKFLLGNVFDVPRPPEEWKVLAGFGKKYGASRPVTYLRVLTMEVIVLNTMQAVTDLLEKRSAIYSDRPRLPMACDIIGFDWVTALMPYGPWWRLHRRELHNVMNENAATKYWDVHQKLNLRFLKRIMDDPADWWEATMWLSGANVVHLSFGMDAAPKNDPWIQLAVDVVEVGSQVSSFGMYLVDWMPSFKHIPSWFPGAKFKRDGLAWRGIQSRSKNVPFEEVKRNMAAGTAQQSIASELLDRQHDDASLSEDLIKNVVGVMFVAGLDTTLSSLRSFFHAMVLNPSIQRLAQEEIDRVIPDGRLPTLHDRHRLPYVDAVVREIMRRYPVLPLAVAHRLSEDDEYQGMHLPKGATVIPNTWAILNNPEDYPDPQAFKPERYLRDDVLDPNAPNPYVVVFGYGRRICPGRHIADAELWLLVATMLSCYNISPAKDARGQDIVPSSFMSSGVISMLDQFPCEITLRSDERKHAIVNELDRVEHSSGA
ncbi:cytochrome P450 [Exidia glandulosa HHB12029]|uniref:Cytochrome P450 n=1 Tax=Exidia glandulosa HHB12029 TaxID=1314781 RepID=A0A165Q3H6_EXIGL|nr:cytochrome P450 [Exidia glandulosa HHB12029]